MKVLFKVYRSHLNKNVEYEVEVEESDRVLDGLIYIKERLDSSFSFRYSCAHGVCGSDAVRINGKNSLACKVLIKNVKKPVVVEPLIGARVIKDLVVDLEPFFSKLYKIKPYLINNTPAPMKERLQLPAERERYDDTTKCILCFCCTTSCPTYWASNEYIGPQAIVYAHRFIFDSRDEGSKERLEILRDIYGIYRCRSVFNCVNSCPRDIDITKAIKQLQRLWM
ncbi:MAG: succinate dehydrogenase iron-sulfur subunit [bacterium]|nr:succinate dehydrogenase iron-sulfur subunit [bacterium]